MSKRIVGISTISYSVSGARTLYADPQSLERLNKGTRRATRTKTLDGGAVVYDAGFSVADLSYVITVPENSTNIGDWFAWLVKTYNLVRISLDDGVFEAVPSKWSVESGNATIELLVMEQKA